MRSISRRARGATLALALSIVLPAGVVVADDHAPSTGAKKRRSIAECTTFDQRDRDDETGVDFIVQNGCTAPVACELRWTVTCAPESRKRRSRKSDSHAFALEPDAGITLTASTARCGDDGWEVDDISWSCEPSHD